jgi:hypothetical protein
MPLTTRMSFVTVCHTYFGRKPGQSLGEFGAELKALSPQDRRELAPLLSVELGTEVALE